MTVEHCNMCGAPSSEHRVLGKRLNASQGRSPRNKIGITTTVMKCNRCDLIFANPLPIPYDLQDHYGVPPESYWKKEYFQVPNDYFKAQIDRFKELTDFKKGMKALDIGAGVGKAMVALARSGFETYGFEPSVPFRTKAIEEVGIDPDRLRLGDMESISYPPEEFDLIVLGVVLEHLYDPAASLVKAMKWLKPGGLIHIEVPSSAWAIHKIINMTYRLQGTEYVGNLSPMHQPYHLYEFSLNSFKRHGKVAGYDVAQYEYFICPTYLPRIFDPILRWYMDLTDTGMQLSIWLRKTV